VDLDLDLVNGKVTTDIYFSAGNVGIANTNPGHDLSVGSNLFVDDDGSNVLVVDGNVSATKYYGDGSALTGISSSGGGQWVGTNEVYFDGKVGIANTNPVYDLNVGSNLFVDDDGSNVLVVDGNVSASYFVGDGSRLTGISSSGGGQWVGTNEVYFDGNVGIANTDPGHDLSVGSNLFVDDDGSNVLVISGNAAMTALTLGEVSIAVSYGLDDILNTSNISSNTIQLTEQTTGLVATGNVQALKFIGDGSELTNIASNLDQIVNNGNVTSNTVQFSNATTGLVATANVEVGGELTVSGNATVSSNLTVSGNATVSSNLTVSGNVVAGYLYGDGSNISGISSTLQAITDSGNVTSNTVQFSNAITSLTAASNIVVTGNVTAGSFLGDGSALTAPGYHAQWTLSCAGLVKWNGSRLSWTRRVIAIPVEKNDFSSVGHLDMDVPVSGTSITYYDGVTNTQTTVTTNSEGFPLNDWEALWYVVTPGEAAATDNSNYVITEYRNSNWKPNSNWLLIAFVNGDSSYEEHLKFIPTGGTFHVWNSIPFVNSWETYDSVYNPGGYYRDNNGIVHLRGLIKNGTDYIIATLPAGYRPGYRILTTGHTRTHTTCRVDVLATGEISLQYSIYDSLWVSLDGIHFKAEQ